MKFYENSNFEPQIFLVFPDFGPKFSNWDFMVRFKSWLFIDTNTIDILFQEFLTFEVNIYFDLVSNKNWPNHDGYDVIFHNSQKSKCSIIGYFYSICPLESVVELLKINLSATFYKFSKDHINKFLYFAKVRHIKISKSSTLIYLINHKNTIMK